MLETRQDFEQTYLLVQDNKWTKLQLNFDKEMQRK